MGNMLKVEDLHVYYDAIHAIKGISFEVEEGEIVTLIGANGAGKTTTLHAISGLLKPRSGKISFLGQDLLATKPYRIVRDGLAQVPEGRRVFSELTVQENLEMGGYIRRDKAGIQDDYDMVFERLPRLKERRKQLAGTLSGGEQQMSRPKMLLLDEPSMGLSPILVKEIFSIIQEVNESGMTILLVEQNAKMALNIANRAYVLETGSIVMSGDANVLSNDPKVIKAYLGG